MEEIRELFISFDPTLYSQHFSNDESSLELFPLQKWDLFLRFLAAFRHGYVGIRYDDQHDLEKIQHRLDSLFCRFPPKSIQCRRQLNGITILYPHPLHFQIETEKYPWSFIQKNVRYADFCFQSQRWIDRHTRLMSSIRNNKRKIPSLFNMAFLACSTQEYAWIRTVLYSKPCTNYE